MVALIKDYSITTRKHRPTTCKSQQRITRRQPNWSQPQPQWNEDPPVGGMKTARAVARARAAEPLAEPQNHQPASYGGDDAIELYLREVGRVKLLTPREEIKLAVRIRKGDKQAREQMIKANLRLVVKIARGFEDMGLPLLDLVSEGNVGLIKAVERFNPAGGAELSTYSSWWIKQSIKRALATQPRNIRRIQ